MKFLSQLISGISLGSIYSLIALGYTMVYGIAKMLNFAHGDVIMIGAFVIYTMCVTAGVPTIISVLIAIVFCTLLGVTIERFAYKLFEYLWDDVAKFARSDWFGDIKTLDQLIDRYKEIGIKVFVEGVIK